MSTSDLAQATRKIPAAAADIFELLATPARHAEIDGSGTVRGVQTGTPERLSAGAKFGMQMKWGGRYKILNHVVEFEEGRRIGWRHFGGHIWRYLLDPVDQDTTMVTEQFDSSTSRAPWLLSLLKAAPRNQASIEATLDRLLAWAETRR